MPEKIATATMGPKMRAAELEAMFRPSMAPCRSGSTEREIRAIVKHMALNLLNKTTRTDSLKTRRKRAGWDDDYLQDVITQAA